MAAHRLEHEYGAGDYVYLAPNQVNLKLTQERFPEVRFLETREVH